MEQRLIDLAKLLLEKGANVNAVAKVSIEHVIVLFSYSCTVNVCTSCAIGWQDTYSACGQEQLNSGGAATR